MRKVIRRSVRGLLTDETGRLLLIRRTKPGLAPYWTVPGGGVELDDATFQDALERELREELGAVVNGVEQVFLHSSSGPEGLSVQHFFLCRLVSLDEEARTGEEFADASRGSYDLDRISLDEVEGVNLKPKELKDFVVRNAEALLAIQV